MARRTLDGVFESDWFGPVRRSWLPVFNIRLADGMLVTTLADYLQEDSEADD